jgi:hypothetical protein
MIEIWKDIRGRRIDPRAFLQAELIERAQKRPEVAWRPKYVITDIITYGPASKEPPEAGGSLADLLI